MGSRGTIATDRWRLYVGAGKTFVSICTPTHIHMFQNAHVHTCKCVHTHAVYTENHSNLTSSDKQCTLLNNEIFSY